MKSNKLSSLIEKNRPAHFDLQQDSLPRGGAKTFEKKLPQIKREPQQPENARYPVRASFNSAQERDNLNQEAHFDEPAIQLSAAFVAVYEGEIILESDDEVEFVTILENSLVKREISLEQLSVYKKVVLNYGLHMV